MNSITFGLVGEGEYEVTYPVGEKSVTMRCDHDGLLDLAFLVRNHYHIRNEPMPAIEVPLAGVEGEVVKAMLYSPHPLPLISWDDAREFLALGGLEMLGGSQHL
ncbi:hypothetical protein HY642_01315 [Candidatus Woesearchaeota archaeon]|nr:hypothetical protein [Candidatus Woesearchaeota archaeon]